LRRGKEDRGCGEDNNNEEHRDNEEDAFEYCPFVLDRKACIACLKTGK
jgi:hypothetical protein